MIWKTATKVAKALANKVRNLNKEQPTQQDFLNKLIDSGNVIVGENLLFDNMPIHSAEFGLNVTNVVIGNDCHILGDISLYSPNARVTIGDRVFIGPGTTLFCRESITIEDDVMISWGCTLIDTNAHSLKSELRANDVVDWKKGYQYKNWEVVDTKSVVVKKKSWVGFNSIVTKGVTLGEGTIVGSGSVVTKSTEDYTIVGGNPASFIKKTQ